MSQTPRKRKRGERGSIAAPRIVNYRQLRHPVTPQAVFSDDAIAQMHETALRVLAELGIKILLPEAREILRRAGAIVNDDTQMVRFGADLIQEALRSAPKSIRLRAINPLRESQYEEGAMIFGPSGGCPNATDALRGRRAGCYRDFEEALILQQHFDVIHILGPSAEPQDIPAPIRHYAQMRAQLQWCDKPLFTYARGRAQVQQNFEMMQIALVLDDDEFRNGTWTKTVINTNSPRLIDRPMAEGLIDYARAGQMCIVTPFCLAGAMAPVTIAGALVLQHAEALGAITLNQMAAPGAPVSYDGFSSNVDMKSGAPAFGTPEHMKLSIGTGQLARHIKMPWRSAAGSAANVADMQAAGENHMGLMGAMMANATLTLHSAGWLEGGLTFGYEKFINDIEALQTIAELTLRPDDDAGAMAFDAIAQIQPGGHFFGAEHTMARYGQAFYTPLVADLSNHGTWTASGAQTSTTRATKIWQDILADPWQPPEADARLDRLAPYIEAATKAGGAPPSE